MNKQNKNICPNGALHSGQKSKNLDKINKQKFYGKNNTGQVTESEGDKISSSWSGKVSLRR